MAPRIWLLCGLAFAGKTTLRRQIVDRTGAVVVCPDDINAERGLWGGHGIPDEEWGRTHRLALEIAGRALAEGRDVVVDDTMCFRWLRDDYREVAARHGAEAFVVLLDVPVDEIMRRMAANEGSGERLDVRPEIMQRLIEQFEWPGSDELVWSPVELLRKLR